jgi:hypothetical protein
MSNSIYKERNTTCQTCTQVPKEQWVSFIEQVSRPSDSWQFMWHTIANERGPRASVQDIQGTSGVHTRASGQENGRQSQWSYIVKE